MSTSIEWTDTVWNPTTGCDRVSAGCDHCYALTLAKRLKGMGSAKYQTDGDPRTSGPGFGIAAHPDTLTAPLRWRKPRKVFVNSMSDLFHPGVRDEFIAKVWAVMARTPQHTYQILTKRPPRMRALLSDSVQRILEATTDEETAAALYDAPWPLPNVWLGVSTENQTMADRRVPALLDTPAAVRFLSCEPLLGPIDLTAVWVRRGTLPVAPLAEHFNQDTGAASHPISWLICGGESGPNARPMHADWARGLRDQCADAGVPYFFKQWGGRTPKASGRELDGCTHDEYPAAAVAV